MKKLTALVLALVMCFGLVACGSTPAPSSTPASEPASQPEATNENFVDPVNGWDVYDELIDQIRTETDLEKRAELMHQAEDILMDTGAILPLYPDQRYTDELADPALILRCYPGEGAWEHYRDNGRDYAYQDGAYTLYRFTQDAAGLHQELARNGYRTYPEIRVERVGE